MFLYLTGLTGEVLLLKTCFKAFENINSYGLVKFTAVCQLQALFLDTWREIHT